MGLSPWVSESIPTDRRYCRVANLRGVYALRLLQLPSYLHLTLKVTPAMESGLTDHVRGKYNGLSNLDLTEKCSQCIKME